MFRVKEAVIRYRTHEAPVILIKESKNVFEFFEKLVEGESKENVFGLYVGNRNEVLCFERLSVGGGETAIVDVPCILRTALLVGSKAVILVHNHLSGSVEPSSDDVSATLKVRDALKTIQLELIDHVIISGRKFLSLKERGVI